MSPKLIRREQSKISFFTPVSIMRALLGGISLFASLLSSSAAQVSSQSLPLGDVNVLIVTDLHSWFGGYRSGESRNSYYDNSNDYGSHSSKNVADHGDILSFYERLKRHCEDSGRDLWFVMNGDWYDGTGLSFSGSLSNPTDAVQSSHQSRPSGTFDHGNQPNTNNGQALVPILEKIPYDVISVGEHEVLYGGSSRLEQLMKPAGLLDWWGNRLVTSNIEVSIDELENCSDCDNFSKQQQQQLDSQRPLGHKYRFLDGRNGRVLTFGFLYNVPKTTNSNDNNDQQLPPNRISVQDVQDVVQEDWFIRVVRGDEGPYDAILVLAHMGATDESIRIILEGIRAIPAPKSSCGNTMDCDTDTLVPVQFVAGHTHIRNYVVLDDAATSLEAGRFLDTVGFVSFPTTRTIAAAKAKTSSFSATNLSINSVPPLADSLSHDDSVDADDDYNHAGTVEPSESFGQNNFTDEPIVIRPGTDDYSTFGDQDNLDNTDFNDNNDNYNNTDSNDNTDNNNRKTITTTTNTYNSPTIITTIGSRGVQEQETDSLNGTTSPYFQFRYIDANRITLIRILADMGIITNSSSSNNNPNDEKTVFDTYKGVELSELIHRVRSDELGLLQPIGCVVGPTSHSSTTGGRTYQQVRHQPLSQHSVSTYYSHAYNYNLNRSLDDEKSLWHLFQHSVVPTLFQNNQKEQLQQEQPNPDSMNTADSSIAMFLHRNSWQYDLHTGMVVVDDVYKIAPYPNVLYQYQNIPTNVIIALNTTLNPSSPMDSSNDRSNLPSSLSSTPYSVIQNMPFYILSTSHIFQPMIEKNFTLIVALRPSVDDGSADSGTSDQPISNTITTPPPLMTESEMAKLISSVFPEWITVPAIPLSKTTVSETTGAALATTAHLWMEYIRIHFPLPCKKTLTMFSHGSNNGDSDSSLYNNDRTVPTHHHNQQSSANSGNDEEVHINLALLTLQIIIVIVLVSAMMIFIDRRLSPTSMNSVSFPQHRANRRQYARTAVLETSDDDDDYSINRHLSGDEDNRNEIAMYDRNSRRNRIFPAVSSTISSDESRCINELI